jgi:conjugal transfer/entry exclusion protein
MLRRIMRLLGFISKQDIEILQAENQLLKIQVKRLIKQTELLAADNAELSDRLSAYQQSDVSALKAIMEEFDLLMIEKMKPVGDA